MRLLSCVVAAAACLAASLAQAAVNPPPPVIAARDRIASPGLPPPPGGQTRLRTFTADPAGLTCASGQPRVVETAPFEPAVATIYPRPQGPGVPPPEEGSGEIDYGFSVGPTGEILDIRRIEGPGRDYVYAPADELAATLAAWRFAVGAPGTGCRLTITRATTDLASASRVALLKMRALAGRSTPPAVLAALNDGRHCRQGENRRPRQLDYVDTRPFEGQAAARPWAAVGYDIAPNGKLRNVRIEAQEGDSALAKGFAAAVAASSYYPGPEKTGCAVTVSARARITRMPPKPPPGSFTRPGDTCDITAAEMNLPANKAYPPAYSRRSVEGWAIVRFDVAPWGQVGNVEVAAAQPNAAFGEYAKMLVNSAKPKAPAQGYRGCIVPVLYAVPDSASDEEASPLDTIAPIR